MISPRKFLVKLMDCRARHVAALYQAQNLILVITGSDKVSDERES